MARPKRTDGKPKHTKIDRGVVALHPGVTLTPADSAPGVGGGPNITIDKALLYEAAKTHASYEHLGRIFGVSGMLLWAAYKDVVEKARAEKKKDLLAAQFDTAIRGQNPTMQIWLGKQYLGQKDIQRVESTGADGQPIKTENEHKVVAYIPDNGRDGTPMDADPKQLGPGEGKPGLDPRDEVYPG